MPGQRERRVRSMLDPEKDEEAEREFVGAPWERRSISDDA